MKLQLKFMVFLFIMAAALSRVAGIDNNDNARNFVEASSQDENSYVKVVRGQRMRRAASKGSKSSTSTSESSSSGSASRTYYELQRCQGDCDNDRDCAVGLVCFQRGPHTAVPGCVGGEHDASSTDYCTSSQHDLPMIQCVGDGWHPASAFPLGLCQGDCDTDSDCSQGLRCYQRSRFQAVPGCTGGESDSSSTDYCIPSPSHPNPTPNQPPRPYTPYPTPRANPSPTPNPTSRNTPWPTTRPGTQPNGPIVELVGNDGQPSSVFPLKLCQGDCDSDSDCAPGLRCFQRGRYQAVPGCSRGDQDASNTDYCIASSSPPSGPNPIPSPSPYTPNPTPWPTPMPNPQSTPLVQYVGNDGNPSSSFPLQACQGDCDDDDDCEYGLFCFQRSKNDPVPGCSGGEKDSTSTDYCAPLPPGQQPMPGTFSLKLYWEEGYFWQEETRERKWCMTFDYDGYPGTGQCWYGQDSRDCSIDQAHLSKCSNDYRQRFVFVELDGGEILIKLGNGKDECFQRYNRSIYIRACDSNNSLQRWYAPNGSFGQSRFEISQKDFESQCVTTAHHPKAGEVVELHSCRASRSRSSQTSYWNKY